MCKKHPRNSTLFRRVPQPNRQQRIMNIIRDVVNTSRNNPFRHISVHRDLLHRRKQQAQKS